MVEYKFLKRTGLDVRIKTDAIDIAYEGKLTVWDVQGLTDANITAGLDIRMTDILDEVHLKNLAAQVGAGLTKHYKDEVIPVAGYFNVTFKVEDGEGDPIVGAHVVFDGRSGVTDGDGEFTVGQVIPGSTLEYTITKPGFEEETGTVDVVDEDTEEEVVMEATTYTVTFHVTDDGADVENASVVFNEETILTDSDGLAVFEEVLPGEDLSYTITKAGFADVEGTVTVVDEDITEEVALVEAYTVTFSVNDGTEPIVGAAIEFNGGTIDTDASGEAEFRNVEPGTDLPYTITKDGFVTKEADLEVVDQDVTETVTLIAS